MPTTDFLIIGTVIGLLIAFVAWAATQLPKKFRGESLEAALRRLNGVSMVDLPESREK
jgi:hypothetical protein